MMVILYSAMPLKKHGKHDDHVVEDKDPRTMLLAPPQEIAQ